MSAKNLFVLLSAPVIALSLLGCANESSTSADSSSVASSSVVSTSTSTSSSGETADFTSEFTTRANLTVTTEYDSGVDTIQTVENDPVEGSVVVYVTYNSGYEYKSAAAIDSQNDPLDLTVSSDDSAFVFYLTEYDVTFIIATQEK